MFPALPSPQEMALWDKAAMAAGLPEFSLMENAAREALHALQSETGPARGKTVLLFMGGGNNGGDAACLARHLHDAGANPLVLHTKPLSSLRGVTARHARLARACGVAFAPAASPPPPLFPRPDIIIDGLLGTGFSGSLREKELALIRRINELRRQSFVLALDIPSGLSGLSGRPVPEAVRAHATVTFEAAKPGLVLPEAAPYVGKLLLRPIGIPRMVREAHPASFQLLPRSLAAALPAPDPLQHKGRGGRVVVVGGSDLPATVGHSGTVAGSAHADTAADYGGGLCGAPHLAALGALRAGAGLVSVAAPAGLCQAIKGGSADIMTFPLGNADDTRWSAAHAAQLLPFLRRCDAVVLGPGIGRDQGARACVAAILAAPGPRPPLVVDADALHALALMPETLASLRPEDALTPHPGEAAPLLGAASDAVQSDRFAALAALLALAPATWILKGAGTLVGAPGHPLTIAPFAEPNLAVGGSGDVLSGCLAALMAQTPRPRPEAETQQADSHLAACLAVLLHAEAGSLLRGRFPCRGNTATEIADTLPAARASLTDGLPEDIREALFKPHQTGEK